MLGGYKIINLKGIDISEDKTIPGTYEAIEGTKHATMITGCVVGDVELPDLFVPMVSEEGVFIGKTFVGTKTLIIGVTAEDTVTGELISAVDPS